ncbi:MAG: DUF559 domain-containing protein [Pacificimonas sp.]
MASAASPCERTTIARRLDPQKLAFARKNRAALTPAEVRLWSQLRAKQLNRLKFTKQAVYGPYIADFACRSAGLIVEVDGDSHVFTEAKDAHRTAYLNELGYRVLRVSNRDVMDHLDWVLAEIATAAKSSG